MKNIKINRNLFAIFTYINTTPEIIDFHEFIQWVLENGYYNDLFIHWHIVHDLIVYHNKNINKVKFHIDNYV